MDLLLVGERSLSSRAFAALDDLHQKQPQLSPRPRRLLDFVCELAMQSHPELIADLLGATELREVLRIGTPDATDFEIDARLDAVESLRPLGLSFNDARELLLHLENNQRLEMSLESQSLLDYLSLRAAANERKKVESKWEIFRRYVDEIKNSGEALPPLSDGQVFVPIHRDYYPLEISFLKLMSSQIQKKTAAELAAAPSPLIELPCTPLFVRNDDQNIEGQSFAIQDLPFLGWLSSDVFVLGERATFKADLQPLFAPTFAHWLEVQSYALPKLPREEQRLKDFFEARKAELFFYPEDFSGKPIQWNEDLYVGDAPLKKSLSPSALESYADCPRRYYLSRLSPLQALREDDLGDPDFMKRGVWLHSCLENFLKADDWSRLESTPLLKEHIDTTFGDKISPLYRKSLESEAVILGERIDRHLRDFEAPLRDRFINRKLQLEEALRAEINTQQLYGKIDRIDAIGDNHYLIWDYKSGDTSGAPATQVKNGKFQWFLYKKIFEKQNPGAVVLGGGYLNPLDAEKSSLFLYRVGPGGAAVDFLEALFERVGHPFHILDIKKSSDIETLVIDQIHDIVGRLQNRNFAATPRKETSCDRCEVVALCGRPYLKRKLDDPA